MYSCTLGKVLNLVICLRYMYFFKKYLKLLRLYFRYRYVSLPDCGRRHVRRVEIVRGCPPAAAGGHIGDAFFSNDSREVLKSKKATAAHTFKRKNQY
jgi:hypothetical protein